MRRKIFANLKLFWFRNVDILENDDDDDMRALKMMEEVIQTNFTGLVHVTRKGYRLMEKSGDYGIIINIGSIAGFAIPKLDFKFNVIMNNQMAQKIHQIFLI